MKLARFNPLRMKGTQMVKSKKKNREKRRIKQGKKKGLKKAIKIGPSTPYGYTEEHLSPYGGLLPLEKFLDGVKFEELFSTMFIEPGRRNRSGSYFFIKGLVLLLFIGFKRIYHFVYIEASFREFMMGDRRTPSLCANGDTHRTYSQGIQGFVE